MSSAQSSNKTFSDSMSMGLNFESGTHFFMGSYV
jgi:hypothetical protein